MTTALVAPTCYKTRTAFGAVAYTRLLQPHEFPYVIVRTQDALCSVPTHWLQLVSCNEYDSVINAWKRAGF